MNEADEIVVTWNDERIAAVIRALPEPATVLFLIAWLLAALFISGIAILMIVTNPFIPQMLFGATGLLLAGFFIYRGVIGLLWSLAGREEWTFTREGVSFSRFAWGFKIRRRWFSARNVVNAGILDRRVGLGPRAVAVRQFGVRTGRRHVGWGRLSVTDTILVNPPLAKRLKELGYPMSAEAGSYSIL